MAADATDTKNVRVVFDDGVRQFYVEKDNVVTGPTGTTFLRAVISHASDPLDVPLGWLEVGDWKYPLNMNKTPVHKYNSRIYIFPDLRAVENAAYVGVILPTLSSERVLKALEEFLHTFSSLKVFPAVSTDLKEVLIAAGMLPSTSAETNAILIPAEETIVSTETAEVSEIPRAIEYEPVPRIEPVSDPANNETIISAGLQIQVPIPNMPELPGGMPLSTMIAASFMAGAERIGHSLVYSADVVNELIREGTLLIMEQISPAEEELEIPIEVLLAFEGVQQATGKAVEFSDFLVFLLRNGTVKVGSWAMPYLRTASHKIYATLTNPDNAVAGQNMDQILQIAGGCAVGVGTVFTGLDYAARVLGNGIATSSAQIAKKKYGRAAESVVGSTTRSLGNVITAKNTLNAVIPKVVAQAAANSSIDSFMHEVPPQQGSAARPTAP